MVEQLRGSHAAVHLAVGSGSNGGRAWSGHTQ